MSLHPPPMNPPLWPKPHWLKELPTPIQAGLEEVYALAGRCESALAVAGLRMLIELVARHAGCPTRPQSKLLDGLLKRGLLGTQERDRLRQVMGYGNDAIHKGMPARGDQLLYLIRCVEHLLQGTFILRSPPA
ncbi:hypothetical protein HMI51_30165 [Corallococcus coralloides]|nr:hypothetical protein [Corallococcus coralloides]